MSAQSLDAAMDRALSLARGGVRGANPLVGAVILGSDGAVVAEGFHRGAGTVHAEIDALTAARQAGRSVAGATMVVTMEPCNHHGRTPPCSRAIVDAGIGRVVYAHDDETAAAGGAATLATAGVDVVSGLSAEHARALNHRWLGARAAQRPFVTGHIGQSLDGYIAAADGTSQWITSAPAREDSHRIRRRIDAILVGTGTLLADNPRLTARDGAGAESSHQPLRVVMGLREVPDDAAARGTDGRFLALPTRDPEEALRTLAGLGIAHVLIEGGATMTGAFLSADLLDELYAHVAPTLLGAGLPSIGALGVETLADARRWQFDDVDGGAAVPIGPDIRLHLQPNHDHT